VPAAGLPVRVWKQGLALPELSLLPVRPSVVWLELVRSDLLSFSE
jgi:hypothetical protein